MPNAQQLHRHRRDLTITGVQAIYDVKVALFLLLIPGLGWKKRGMACLCGVGIVALNEILDWGGYFDSLAHLVTRVAS